MKRYNEIFLLFAQKDLVDKNIIPMMLRQAGININNNDLKKVLNEYEDLVNYDQFVEMIEKVKCYEIDIEQVRKAFKAYDPDNTGYINVGILKNLMMERKDSFDDLERDEVLKILCPDSEGRINYELFIKKLISN